MSDDTKKKSFLESLKQNIISWAVLGILGLVSTIVWNSFTSTNELKNELNNIKKELQDLNSKAGMADANIDRIDKSVTRLEVIVERLEKHR